MIRTILMLLISFSVGAAQTTPSCETLINGIDLAFDRAEEVIMTTEITQGNRSFAYSQVRLFKDAVGEWQSEMLEERGQRRPDDAGGDDNEPDFAFSCEGHELEATANGWTLALPEQDSEIPVKAWQLDFVNRANAIVPAEISGDFEAKILFVPFSGTFSTRFSDWLLPATLPVQPGD